MARMNLYFPSEKELNRVRTFAKIDSRSPSEFIRRAIREKIERMLQESVVKKEADLEQEHLETIAQEREIL